MKSKRIWILTAAAALVVSAAGCAMPVQPGTDGTQQGGGSSMQDSAGQTQQGAASNPFSRPRTDSEQEEPKTVELQVQQEDGTTDTVTATVYTGNGYTLAIPEGWERDDNEPQWNPHANDAVEFTVRYYDGKKADAVAELFRKDEDDYTFEAPQTGALAHVSDVVSLRGSEMDNGTITDLVAYFVNHGDKGCYGLILECPTEASESFGAYLGAIANSFTLAETGK